MDRADQLLDSALEEFVDVGYATVGVKEITTHAGVSHGTFYNYFDSKRHLLTVLVEREMADFFAMFDQVSASLPRPCDEQSFRASVRALNEGLLQLMVDHAEVLSFILIDVPGVDQEALDGHITMFRAAARRATEMLQAAVDDGIADPELHVDFAGQAWMSYLLGIGGPVIADGSDIGEVATVADVLTVLLLDGLPAVESLI
ncbi:TetR/AcrR family transcriptional regulator [Gordonia sp. CPCC 205333]|uniref:TetR/AcrR family transcriptional regulator n=1 Tax=Gordonia sp. CPCC 205333 TaxID=3140790 RepID=UPI003AF34094